MKNFTFLFTLLLFGLGFAFQANATNDCGCDDNKLKNASFENGTGDWTKGTYNTSLSTSTGYNMCGTYNGVINGSGYIYQDVAITGGSAYYMKVYGGTHENNYDHKFKLIFYRSNGSVISEAVKDVNYEVGSGSTLAKYTLTGTAPSDAVKVRFQASSSGNYLKIDGACLTITPPATPVDCDCVASNQYIKNASFENGTNDWSKSGSFGVDDAYEMCGSKNGLITGTGSIWQDINVVAGAKVDVTAYGGTHNTGVSHTFKLTFYDGAGNKINANEAVVDMNYKVVDSKLKQFSISATAPAGAVKVRFSVNSSGDYFKVDAICTTITQPVTCTECNGNTLQNPSFENGTANWDVTGTLTVEPTYAVCGTNGAKLTAAGKFWQDVEVQTTTGKLVTLNIYAAFSTSSPNSQKIQLVYLNEVKEELGQTSQDVTKSLTEGTWGLTKYTLNGTLPAGTKYVRVLLSSNGNDFLVDNACLTFSGPPMPVTLSVFSAKKEGATAQLTWATTSESNSAYFEVQHSQDGKNWTALAQVAAKGESRSLETYSYTHTNPLAANLYRLKMVDLDETFAYSSIRNLNFDGQEQLSVYPNPTVDRIKVSSNQPVTNVKVYNQTGALVLNAVPDSSSEVDLTRLSQGTYYVKINNGPSMRKILIVR
ncbi:T9SS type A sorting domain-containing protein [Dyadobacter sp. 676]|uniref:T9SS type A sorting domain-containing protein n=1 Tax=Dyadobacter sp. 676 TaxID=3088362 RepID=A0AAU8FR90_9BACT